MKTNDVLLGIMAGKRIEELSELQQLISNNDAVFEFCFAHGLLRPAPDCACGSGVMHLVCQRARGDGCCWRCPTCSAMNSIRCGSFFARKKLPIAKLLELIFYWAQGEGVKQTAQYTGTSEHTTSLTFGQLQDACAVWADRHPAIIGGPGQAVQIDETAITTRKQHVGRLPRTAQIWVFGGICEETGECFCEVVPDRRRGTLVPLIEKHVRPGTHVKSDGWGAYRGLDNYKGVSPYAHSTVNHRMNFVNPQDGTHTQKVERMWRDLKDKKKRANGVPRAYLTEYVKEWMWRRGNVREPKGAFMAAVELISETTWT